jgi:hypothetical protein
MKTTLRDQCRDKDPDRRRRSVTNRHARVSYRDFLCLWKDADPDPDVPTLIPAKSKYAKVVPMKPSGVAWPARRAVNGD